MSITLSTQPVTVAVEWTHVDVIPPRCRTPRDIRKTNDVTTPVRVVEEGDAPVAFTIDAEHGDSVYRAFELSYWVPARYGIDRRMKSPLYGSDGFKSEMQMVTALAEAAQQFILINGELWERTDTEPVYGIITFGFCHGTSLTVSTYRHEAGSPAPAHTFPADQFEEAKAAAIRVSTERGDRGHDGTLGVHAKLLAEEQPRITVNPAAVLPRGWAPSVELDYLDGWDVDPLDRALSFGEAIVKAGLAVRRPNPLGQLRWQVEAGRLSEYDTRKWTEYLQEARVSEHDVLEHCGASE